MTCQISSQLAADDGRRLLAKRDAVIGLIKGRRTAVQQHVVRSACKADFGLFVYLFFEKFFWGRPGIFHKKFFAIANRIASSSTAGKTRSLSAFYNILSPRGNAKTTLIHIFIVWQLLYQREKYILVLTSDEKKAREMMSNIIDKLAKDNINAIYSPMLASMAAQQGVINGTKLVCTSLGTNIRGAQYRGARPTLVIADDIEKDEDAHSPAARQANFAKWHSAVMKALPGSEYPIQPAILLVNTPLHPEALAVRLQDDLRFESLIFPAIISEPVNTSLWQGFDDIYLDTSIADPSVRRDKAKQYYLANKSAMDEGVRVNWQDAEPYWQLRLDRLASGLSVFAREKQCSPINIQSLPFVRYLCLEGTQQIKRELQFDLSDDVITLADGATYDINTMPRFAYLDGAGGKHKDRGCYAVLVVMSYIQQPATATQRRTPGLIFCLDAMVSRDPPESQVSQILDLAEMYNIAEIGVEATTFQTLYKPLLELGVKARPTQLRTRVRLIPPGATSTHVPKLTFIENVLISLALGRNTLRLNKNLSGEFYRQLTLYPDKYVDVPDALANAIHAIYSFTRPL